MLLPTLQFPNIGLPTAPTRSADTQAELANYRAFDDWYQWEDVDGDGQIVIGAEQFPAPSCPNPITECANSSWYVWTAASQTLPGRSTPRTIRRSSSPRCWPASRSSRSSELTVI